MRKKILLFSTVTLLSMNGIAQEDVTPSGWNFDAMERGSAKSLFIENAECIGARLFFNSSNFKIEDPERDGAFVLNRYVDEERKNIVYDNLTEEEKTVFSNFYDACQIIDGGLLGNLFCFQGIYSEATDVRAQKNISSINAPSINILSPNKLTPGIYQMTVSMRLVMNENYTDQRKAIGVYVTNSTATEPLRYAGSDNKNIAFDMGFEPEFNNDWASWKYEIEVTEHTPTPLINRFTIKGPLADNSLLLMKLKLERVNSATLDGDYKIVEEKNWDDTPTGINEKQADKVIVYTTKNVISIIDAKEPVEVFTTTGQLVKKENDIRPLIRIPVAQEGVYIVKTGAFTKKIVLN